MQLEFFIKDDCPKCPPVHEMAKALRSQEFDVIVHNVEYSDGLARAAFLGVYHIPTVLLTKKDSILKTWHEKMPTLLDLMWMAKHPEVKGD